MKDTDMNYIQFNNDLHFLSEYHKKLKSITDNIYNNLPKTDHKFNGKKFGIVKYSELENWDVSSFFGESTTLKSFSIKLCQMVDKGNADNILPLVTRLVNSKDKGFNWDHTRLYLTENDCKKLKEFFKL